MLTSELWWPNLRQGGISLFLRTQIIFLGSACLIFNITPLRMQKGLAGDQLRQEVALDVPAPLVLFAPMMAGCPLNYIYSGNMGTTSLSIWFS